MDDKVFILDSRYRGYPDSGYPNYHSLKRETVVNQNSFVRSFSGLVPISFVAGTCVLCTYTSILVDTSGIGLQIVREKPADTFGL